MTLNINITRFQPPAPAGGGAAPASVNALKDLGAIDQIINHITNQGGNDQQKFEDLLDCLSQAFSLQGRYQGECESKLKDAVYVFAKQFSAIDVQNVIQLSRFKCNSKLEDAIKKVDYLSSSYFRRLAHHLKDSYGNNKRYGVSYFTAGTTMMLVGGLQTAFSTDASNDKTKTAWATFAAGGAMMAFPLVNSITLAFRDEP